MSAHQEVSLVASIVSMVCRIVHDRTQVSPNREQVTEAVASLLDSYGGLQPDHTGWENKPMPGMYDVYLELREAEGTLTGADLVRGGMVASDFTSGAEFVKHNARIHAHRKNPQTEFSMKTCSACGKTKDRSQFPKKGGSKCKRCVDANTRDRRLAAKLEAKQETEAAE